MELLRLKTKLGKNWVDYRWSEACKLKFHSQSSQSDCALLCNENEIFHNYSCEFPQFYPSTSTCEYISPAVSIAKACVKFVSMSEYYSDSNIYSFLLNELRSRNKIDINMVNSIETSMEIYRQVFKNKFIAKYLFSDRQIFFNYRQ